ncbi:hypothetical protein EsDP_00001384 [Epichloe bromicola]|uniref:Superoxide dismutase copper/zinc binding domain-containing protein n=1 Tax=Epichloe bromicola TaxID=79588 RepID=A0ABQ0CHP8_9HYPO
MRTSAALLAVLAAVDTSYAAENAPVVTNNPIDVIYTATLPREPFFQAPELSGNVKGFISASAPPDGVGVRFTVRLENLPKTGGPFPYHLHMNKAAGGNCASAGAHLDPTNRGEQPPCDAGNEPSCQVGDLAGKFGRINSDPFTAEYVDKFVSLKEGDPAFFGNRSFVVHLANTTRITCADFVKDEPSFPNDSPTSRKSTSTLLGNTNSPTSLPVTTRCPTTATVVTSTSSSLPSDGRGGDDDDDDDDCKYGNGNNSTCVSRTGAGFPTPSGPLGNNSFPWPTTVMAAAGTATPGSLAGWICMTALILGVL